MKNSKVDKAIILVYAIWWPFVVPQKRKFAKIWATYKFGGVKLCWHRDVEKFGQQQKLPFPESRRTLCDFNKHSNIHNRL